jgi:hypothetical protein
MNLPAAPNVRVETAGNDAVYRLPSRPLGKMRWLGLVPMIFSFGWLYFTLPFLSKAVHDTTDARQKIFHDFALAFFLIWAVFSLGPAAAGLKFMIGRFSLRWRAGHLSVKNSLGPFGWWHRVNGRIRQFTLNKDITPGRNNARELIADLANSSANLAALQVEFEDRPRLIILSGYPAEMLMAVASDLSGRMGLSPRGVQIVEDRIDDDPAPPVDQVPEKPSGSKISVQHGSASVALEIPARGLWKGSFGLFPFGCAWCGFMGVFTAVYVRSETGKGDLPWPFICVFWLIGIGFMLGGFTLGKLKTKLQAGSSGVTVIRTNPFGEKRREFPRTEIASIATGPSGVEVNNKPLTELQIKTLHGKKFGLLAGRDVKELAWIAAELNKVTGLAAPSATRR